MNNLLLKRNQFLYKITSFILILSNLSCLTVKALESPENSTNTFQQESTNISIENDGNDELKQQFQPLIENIF